MNDHRHSIDACEQARIGHLLRRGAFRNVITAVRMWDLANRLDLKHPEPGDLMGLEQKLLAAQDAKITTLADQTAALTTANAALQQQVTDLQAQVPAPGTVKDAADLQAEKDIAGKLGVDPTTGDPIPPAPPAGPVV